MLFNIMCIDKKLRSPNIEHKCMIIDRWFVTTRKYENPSFDTYRATTKST